MYFLEKKLCEGYYECVGLAALILYNLQTQQPSPKYDIMARMNEINQYYHYIFDYQILDQDNH